MTSVQSTLSNAAVVRKELSVGLTMVGAETMVSIKNGVAVTVLLTFHAESVTVIVQLEYVPSASVLKVTVLLPTDATEVALLHEPPYEIVPASSVVKV